MTKELEEAIEKVMKDALHILVNIQVGSHLYGTATPQSDRDYKGVFLPSKRMLLSSKIPKSLNFNTTLPGRKNSAQDVDEEFYSLHYFLQLACEGQTIALDMLHAPESMILENSEIWRTIVRERQRFYTKNLNSFIRYARRQATKYGIKGARLNAAKEVLAVLHNADASVKLQHVWEQLPQTEYACERGRDPQGFRQYVVCDKMFQESAAIGYVVPILEKFTAEYGRRAQLAADNKQIDWKAVSHALRVAYQVKEILTKKTIHFPLEHADFLREIKEGKPDYLKEVAPRLDSLMDEVEDLLNSSTLPEQSDTAYWEDFLCDTLERELFA